MTLCIHASAGVDVGSWATKVVVLGPQGNVVSRAAVLTAADMEGAARRCLEQGLEEAREVLAQELEPVSIMATGYGRYSVDLADGTITEILAHALGCHEHFPRRITVVDIGGQDSKVVRLDQAGNIVSFKMNRRCASGTGAFLEATARRLELDADRLNHLASMSSKPVELGAYCTVFTQAEIIDRVRAGTPMEDLARGLMLSVVKRVREMDRLEGDVVVSGGVVAYHPVLVEVMAEVLGREVLVPPHPQYMGALGAALKARRLEA